MLALKRQLAQALAERDAAVKRADRVGVEAQAAVEQHRCACVCVFIYYGLLWRHWLLLSNTGVCVCVCYIVCTYMNVHVHPHTPTQVCVCVCKRDIVCTYMNIHIQHTHPRTHTRQRSKQARSQCVSYNKRLVTVCIHTFTCTHTHTPQAAERRGTVTRPRGRAAQRKVAVRTSELQGARSGA